MVGLIGEAFESLESGRRQMNRYGCLMLDDDDGDNSDRHLPLLEDEDCL